MLRSRYFVFFLLALVLGVLAFMVGVVIREADIPAPAGDSGCTSSISFRIEEDGSVTSWCNEEVTK
jgi:hypothetical protein